MNRARSRPSLSTQLIEALTDRIRAGHYKLGDRLPTEKDMIEEFGVSRTVVREAIANLKANGLVATRQGVGAFVLGNGDADPAFRIASENLVVIEDVIKALELRLAIESEAAALAARRRTDDDLRAMTVACERMEAANAAGEDTIDHDIAFHRGIARATENRHFLGLFNYLGEVLVPRARVQTHRFDAGTMRDYIERVCREHRQILSAIEGGDADAARAGMRLHLGSSRDRLAQGAKIRT